MKNSMKFTLAFLLLLPAMGYISNIPHAAQVKDLTVSKNQEAMAVILNLYDRYAQNITSKNEVDKKVDQKLGGNVESRKRAKRFMENFRKIPAADRKKILGQWSDISGEVVSEEHFKNVFTQIANQGTPIGTMKIKPDAEPADLNKSEMKQKDIKGSVNDVWDFDKLSKPGGNKSVQSEQNNRLAFNIGKQSVQRFGLCYKGLRCREEVDYDGGSSDDEIYIITTVFDPEQANSITSRQPQGGGFHGKVYENLDSGEKRKGPGWYVWHTRSGARPIILTVSVWEQDAGDPDEVAKVISDISDVITVACSLVGYNCDFLGFSGEIIGGLLKLFSFGEDDLIETVVTRISADDMDAYLSTDDSEFRGIPYDLVSIHNENEGADYRVFYRFQPE